jgi:hypothetical protein
MSLNISSFFHEISNFDSLLNMQIRLIFDKNGFENFSLYNHLAELTHFDLDIPPCGPLSNLLQACTLLTTELKSSFNECITNFHK